MTAVEYLSQAHRLNLIIASDLEELENLRQMSYSISSPSWREKTGGTRPTDPPFVKCIFKIMTIYFVFNFLGNVNYIGKTSCIYLKF